MNSPDGNAENPVAPPRRRRSFLAVRQESAVEADTLPVPTIDDDDIPVLTEVVSSGEEAHDSPVVDKTRPDASTTLDARLEELATLMADAIGRQMAYELPTLIEATLLNASEDLRSGITATMEAALRDFIARRKQLALPLDEPEAR